MNRGSRGGYLPHSSLNRPDLYRDRHAFNNFPVVFQLTTFQIENRVYGVQHPRLAMPVAIISINTPNRCVPASYSSPQPPYILEIQAGYHDANALE